MKYKSHVAKLGGMYWRVTYARRHWFFRWQLIGIERWEPTEHVVTQYDYTCWKAAGF